MALTPAAALTEIYQLPVGDPPSPRGMDIDGNGVVWTSLASGHRASFERRKCKGSLNRLTATGQSRRVDALPVSRPQFKGVTDSGSAEARVNQFNMLGLGATVLISIGNGYDALLALVDGKLVVCAHPLPDGGQGHGRPHR